MRHKRAPTGNAGYAGRAGIALVDDDGLCRALKLGHLRGGSRDSAANVYRLAQQWLGGGGGGRALEMSER